MTVRAIAEKARKAHIKLKSLTKQQRNSALLALAADLRQHTNDIIIENQKDLEAGQKNNLSSALLDRLKLDQERIEAMAKGVEDIAAQDEIIGSTISETRREDGLIIQKEKIPLGVIGMIFESRPNVVVDCSALAIKSGNSIILKGGKEAYFSNTLLGSLIGKAISNHIPENCVHVLDSKDRSLVAELITLTGLVDVVIPRGGEKLIQFVYDNSKIPVIAHFKGLCHAYIDASADLKVAKDIVLNGKASRPGVCNALESLILHKDLDSHFVSALLHDLKSAGVEVRLDEALYSQFPGYSQAAASDWDEEYLDLIISIKQVGDVTEAVDHIAEHGSFHTEVIVARDENAISTFKAGVDCSCLMVNASSRFNDGGQLGLGAEIGISTTKLHAYGPMGAAELTTTRYVVVGEGHTR